MMELLFVVAGAAVFVCTLIVGWVVGVKSVYNDIKRRATQSLPVWIGDNHYYMVSDNVYIELRSHSSKYKQLMKMYPKKVG